VLGLDERLADLGAGQGVAVALLVAVLLGLRHATDPDHLTAVSTLVLADARDGTRRALRLGLAWGLGHGLTLLLLGVPLVLLSRSLPPAVQQAAEVVVGLVIVGLAVRLLRRGRTGELHAHPHEHGGVWHAHPHVHEPAPPVPGGHAHAPHEHRHADALGRSPAAAFGIGMVHGVGGSAGVSIVLIGAISSHAEALAALVLFAAATAASMAAVSAVFGRALATRPVRRRFATLTPALGTLALLFGAWYALGAAGAVPYAF
jgi:ABC-type nickel/cobalt efflux system permease component RcnA